MLFFFLHRPSIVPFSPTMRSLFFFQPLCFFFTLTTDMISVITLPSSRRGDVFNLHGALFMSSSTLLQPHHDTATPPHTDAPPSFAKLSSSSIVVLFPFGSRCITTYKVQTQIPFYFLFSKRSVFNFELKVSSLC